MNTVPLIYLSNCNANSELKANDVLMLLLRKNKGGEQRHPDWSPEAESNDNKEALLETAHNWSLLITRHYIEAKNKLIAQKMLLCRKL